MPWKNTEPMDEKERFAVLAETGRFTIIELYDKLTDSDPSNIKLFVSSIEAIQG